MDRKRAMNQDAFDRYEGDSGRPFNGSIDDELFDVLEAAAVDDATLPIMSITPDMTQPRRIVPAQFRDEWNGSPATFRKVIEAWERAVMSITAGKFPVKGLLDGKSSIADYVVDDPVVVSYARLIDLASQIKDVGLQQSIGVVKRGDQYRIIYGERRWAAFQLLNYHYGGAWSNIPAKVANVDEWTLAKIQAAENFQRVELNAIEKARQFAKLLIIARSDNDASQYDSWNTLVVDCDRAYYAQVANGEIHRIPRGMGTQFEQALGISTAQMRQYRNVLKLTDDHKVNDAIWMLGDAGDWAEQFMREIAQYLSVADLDRILSSTGGYTVTTVTVSDAEAAFREAIQAAKDRPSTPDQPIDKSQWPAYFWVGKEVYAGNQKVFVEDMVSPEVVTVVMDDRSRVDLHISALIDVSVDTPAAVDEPVNERIMPQFGQAPAPENMTYQDERLKWIGKPAMYGDDPVLVIMKSDIPGDVVIQHRNQRLSVPVSELSNVDLSRPAQSINPNPRQAVHPFSQREEALSPPDDDGDELPDGEDDALVLSNFNTLRITLAFYKRQVVELHHVIPKDERVIAAQLERDIDEVLQAKIADYSRDDMEALLHEVFSGIETIHALIVADMGERFNLIIQEYGEIR